MPARSAAMPHALPPRPFPRRRRLCRRRRHLLPHRRQPGERLEHHRLALAHPSHLRQLLPRLWVVGGVGVGSGGGNE